MKDKSNVTVGPTLQEAILLEHIAINPTSNTTAELVISPVYFREWLSLDQKNQYGQLVLIRQNTFAVGSGPATYGLKLLASVEDAKFILPAPIPAPTRSVAQIRAKNERYFRKEVNPTIPRVVSPEMEIPENVKVEDLPLYTFAVGSGSTSEGQPLHWGESYDSFQDMIKRQQPFCFRTISLPAEAVGVPNITVLKTRVGYGPGDGGDLLRRVSMPFRVCKIPRRYVISVKVYSAGTGSQKAYGYVGYLPVGTRDPTTPADLGFVGRAYPSANTIPSALPYTYFDSDTIAELEVPYTNPTSTALTKQYFDADADVPSNIPYYDSMRLVVYYVVEGDIEGCNIVIEGFEMGADEARVGVFVGMPKAMIQAPGIWPDHYGAIEVQAEAGIVGGIIKDVGGALEKVVQDVLPDSVTGMAKDLLGSLLDVPNVSTAPELMRLKKRGYYSNTTQVAMLERLSASAGAMQPMVPGDIGTTRDEMKLSDFAQRRFFLETHTIPVVTESETLIYSVPVGPFLLQNYAMPNVMAPIDFVAYGMQYWRGGIEFELEFITSNYDELKVEVCFSPDTVEVPPYDTMSTQYYKSALVKGTNNRFRFKIPHFADMPWKLTWSGQALGSNDPSQPFSCDYSHGMFAVYLGSRISSPSTTPNTVYMNVYVRAADDFEVAVPSYTNTSIVIGVTPESRAAKGIAKKKQSTREK